jgi:microcystin-dependent protein
MSTKPSPFRLCARLASALVMAMVVLAMAFPARGEVPSAVNYQGKLTDGTGNNAPDGIYQVQFRIWSDPVGGTLVWGQSYSVHLQAGYFNVILGGPGGAAISGATQNDITLAFADAARYLGLTVARDLSGVITNPQEITPRQQFLSAPYALKSLSAGNADTFGNRTPDNYALSSGGTISGNLAVSGTLGVTGQSVFSNGTTINANLTVQGAVTVKKADGTTALQIDPASPGGIKNGGIVPIGGIIMWSGSAIPDGWAICDGTAGTPDLRGKFVMGTSASHSSGSSGGAENQTLTAANLPPHQHTYSDSYFVDSGHSDWKGGGTPDSTESTGRSGSNSLSTGSGPGTSSSFSILPPYYALAFIMRKA